MSVCEDPKIALQLLDLGCRESEDIMLVVDLKTGEYRTDHQKLFRLYGMPTAFRKVERFLEFAYQRLHPDDRVRFLKDFKPDKDGFFNITDEKVEMEYRFISSLGQCFWLKISSCILETDDVSKFCKAIHIKNTTLIHTSEQFFTDMDGIDSTTGTMKPEYLRKAINTHLAQPGKCGIMIRILTPGMEEKSREKKIDIGAVQEEMAHTIYKKIRSYDMVSRISDEELIVFISGLRSSVSVEKDIKYFESVFLSIFRQYGIDGLVVPMIGFAAAVEDGADFDSLCSACVVK